MIFILGVAARSWWSCPDGWSWLCVGPWDAHNGHYWPNTSNQLLHRSFKHLWQHISFREAVCQPPMDSAMKIFVSGQIAYSNVKFRNGLRNSSVWMFTCRNLVVSPVRMLMSNILSDQFWSRKLHSLWHGRAAHKQIEEMSVILLQT
jgi:hypothetical protein